MPENTENQKPAPEMSIQQLLEAFSGTVKGLSREDKLKLAVSRASSHLFNFLEATENLPPDGLRNMADALEKSLKEGIAKAAADGNPILAHEEKFALAALEYVRGEIPVAEEGAAKCQTPNCEFHGKTSTSTDKTDNSNPDVK